MKITEVETVQIAEHPNILYVRIHTDEGLVGLGETFSGAEAVASWVHETAALTLVGADALAIERIWHELNPIIGFNATGVEARGRSAIDIALWDILGQVAGLPIYQLLGGAVRDRIRVYNTCAGYRYVRDVVDSTRLLDNWHLADAGGDSPGPYEDLDAALNRADELAQSLLEEGITGMKLWPLDPYAASSRGRFISDPDLRRGIEPFEKIRRAVGDRIDIMVELHSLWNLPAARKIFAALDELSPFWYEDPIKMDDLGALRELARSTAVPVAASENLGTRWSFRDLLERRAAGVIIYDPTYAGGISEGKKISAMAEAHQLPIATHDCTGPVNFTVNVHLAINVPNTLIQEFVRAYYSTWYKDLVTELPRVEKGFAYPLDGPGLGTALQPALLKRSDVTKRSTTRARARPA